MQGIKIRIEEAKKLLVKNGFQIVGKNSVADIWSVEDIENVIENYSFPGFKSSELSERDLETLCNGVIVSFRKNIDAETGINWSTVQARVSEVWREMELLKANEGKQ